MRAEEKCKKIIWSPHRILFAVGALMLIVSVCFFVINTSNNKGVVVPPTGDEEELIQMHISAEDVPYLTQMCNAQGECGEDPSTPSPRTTFSSRSKSQDMVWFAFHEKLIESSYSYQLNKRKNVVFLGDSITESFLGTSYDDGTAPRLVGVKDVFLEFCEKQNINPLVLAISGDQTQHLLYRLQDGEMSPQLKSNPELTFVLHIGTNNIGAGFLPGETAAGVIKVAEYILKETVGQLLIVLLLPRGDGKEKLVHICPPRCSTDGHPYESFLGPLRTVNDLVSEWFKTELSHRVDILNNWDIFIKHPDHDTEVDINLMPDMLHPNAEGHSLFLARIATKLNQIYNKIEY